MLSLRKSRDFPRKYCVRLFGAKLFSNTRTVNRILTLSRIFSCVLNVFLTGIIKHAEAERQRKIEEERRAKLDEIAEKQRQRERELEEKERQRREALLGRSTDGPSRPSEPVGSRPSEPVATAPAAAAAATGAGAPPAAGKYVPRFRRPEVSAQAPPAEPDRWGSSRQDDRTSQPSDRWRSDDRKPSFGAGGGSKSTWSSSRVPPRGGGSAR